MQNEKVFSEKHRFTNTPLELDIPVLNGCSLEQNNCSKLGVAKFRMGPKDRLPRLRGMQNFQPTYALRSGASLTD